MTNIIEFAVRVLRRDDTPDWEPELLTCCKPDVEHTEWVDFETRGWAHGLFNRGGFTSHEICQVEHIEWGDNEELVWAVDLYEGETEANDYAVVTEPDGRTTFVEGVCTGSLIEKIERWMAEGGDLVPKFV